ncbi:MAG: hypothetical protein ACI909_002279, partial [Planctomycetota bacterium]
MPGWVRGNAYDLNAGMDSHGGPWEPEYIPETAP